MNVYMAGNFNSILSNRPMIGLYILKKDGDNFFWHQETDFFEYRFNIGADNSDIEEKRDKFFNIVSRAKKIKKIVSKNYDLFPFSEEDEQYMFAEL